nr:MAG TPA: hypothetical protein [Caudoviricetes sp.]
MWDFLKGIDLLEVLSSAFVFGGGCFIAFATIHLFA